MSPAYISASIRRLVRERAGGRCEYCLLPEETAFFAHEPDHIVAQKHGGGTVEDNLAYSCFDCNRFKGSDIASLDPIDGQMVALFNPRSDQWRDHFLVREGEIVPLTPVGRVTVRLLKLNLPERLEVRRALGAFGRYP
ncbi:MAG TPA: HNH endonuclease signature motif containing protein [Blastocatellia bacterium]